MGLESCVETAPGTCSCYTERYVTFLLRGCDPRRASFPAAESRRGVGGKTVSCNYTAGPPAPRTLANLFAELPSWWHRRPSTRTRVPRAKRGSPFKLPRSLGTRARLAAKLRRYTTNRKSFRDKDSSRVVANSPACLRKPKRRTAIDFDILPIVSNVRQL